MRWYGKLLGFIAGFLLFRPNPLFGGLIGVFLGHAFDNDWFSVSRDAPWRELGLPRHASDEEVDAAYRRLIAQYHPDKLVDAAPDLQAHAQERVRQINAAYQHIKALRKRSM